MRFARPERASLSMCLADPHTGKTLRPLGVAGNLFPMEATVRPPAWKTMLAFAIIYFVWGSTFLAIRVGVREVPPLLLASMRFFIAGVVLFGWMRLRGTPSPSRREWLAASALALCIFVVDYGLLFLAQPSLPAGIGAGLPAAHPGLIGPSRNG